MKIRIAIASSRLAKTWQNVTWEWSDLVARCRKTKRTGETMAEYKKMSKAQQAEKKDVGGFVGGYLREGKRKNGYVEKRSIVTLDIDFGDLDLWEDFTLDFDCASFLYSTHKHSRETPRYRLVVLLDREVEPWEYEPIARKVAERIGIDKFDHTTYELPRLFYWPSTSEDAEYVFEEQKGEPLNADEILAEYADPKNATEWPYGKNETVAIRKDMKKAGEPTEKNGLIGAFNRAYSISEAISNFLGDAYEPTVQDDRYTYKLGSVAGGLVVYDDKFAYSHHDTDPASRQLCNAFDLVRIHKFGDLDDGKFLDDVTKLPSYKAMMEFASKDKGTSSLVLKERKKTVEEDFGGIGCDDADEDEDIKLGLDKHGFPQSSISNIIKILEHDPKLKGKFWHCDFSSYDFASNTLPWQRSGSAWSDKDDANLRVYFDLNYSIQGKEKISDALDRVFSDHRKHPIREYLNGLKWDGTERLDHLIIDYIGADDNQLNRDMTRKIFTAAVKRVFEPGCKFDYCLILSGGEGIGKSTFLKIMGGDWFSDSIVTTEGKEGMESLRLAWVIELAELASIKRSDVEQVKNFLSKQEDCYRAAYGKRSNHYPRQCVFFGTTNELTFLKGDTGNRRFWVIPVDASQRKIEGGLFKRLKEDRDQLWAEAVARYKQGEKLYLDEEQEKAAKERQQQYNVDNDDPTPGLLDEYLEQRLPADWYTWDTKRRQAFMMNPDPLSEESMERTKFFAGEFVYEKLGYSPSDKNYPFELKKVNKLMKAKEGWEEERIRVLGYGQQRGFVRICDNVTK